MSRAKTSEFDEACKEAIRKVIEELRDSGQLPYTRKQLLQSDEAGRYIICRLPVQFNMIDPNHYRRLCDALDKQGEENGGLPRLTNRKKTPVDSTAERVLAMHGRLRKKEHSPEYEEDTPERQNWRAEVKREKGYRCAACNAVRPGGDLEVHHYNYDRLGNEHIDDVGLACSREKTGKVCHALLDLARMLNVEKCSNENGRLF
jgi:hypothetical protein